MSTVFVFGAGASFHAGYPLAAPMGEALLNSMLGSANPMIRTTAEYLVDHFGMPSNFEDFITEIQSRISAAENDQTTEGKTEYRRLGTRLGWLGTGLKEWFGQIRSNAAATYADFADRIASPGDVVLTFNYDDALDCELKKTNKWDISQGYGFPFSSEQRSSDVLLLKLHGSINWLLNPFNGATGGSFFAGAPYASHSLGEYPVILLNDLKFLGYDEFSGRVYKSGGALPCLIMPGRTKEFFIDTSLGRELSEFWDSLWSQAITALKTCSKLVICGYSMPVADERARDLLFQSPSKATDIQIVSGDQSNCIADEFRDLGFHNVSAYGEGHFEKWVAAQPIRT